MNYYNNYGKTYQQKTTTDKKELSWQKSGAIKVALWRFDNVIASRNSSGEVQSETPSENLSFLIQKGDKALWLKPDEVRILNDLLDNVTNSALDNMTPAELDIFNGEAASS